MPSPQQDYYREFADKLIARIREGTAPWQKPWQPGESALPESLATGRKYAGGNTLYLAMAAEDRGFSDNRWATYRQIKALGGHVRKGETGERVVFFARQRRVAQRDQDGKVRKGRDGQTLYYTENLDRPVWRTYVVFNAEQAGGLRLPKRANDQEPAWLPRNGPRPSSPAAASTSATGAATARSTISRTTGSRFPSATSFRAPRTTIRSRSTNSATPPATSPAWAMALPRATTAPTGRRSATASRAATPPRPTRRKSCAPRSLP